MQLALVFWLRSVYACRCSIRIAVNCELTHEEVDKVVTVLESVTQSL